MLCSRNISAALRSDTRSSSGPPTSSAAQPAFRGDIEGLRAIAILLVLVYHAGVSPFSGGFIGVDVFFVISGFLITGLLVREAEQSGTVAMLRFYGRRMRRLLPAAGMVLLTVVGLAAALMTPLDRRDVASDVVAAAFYVINWQQAVQSVDYSAAAADPSPLQHFWSLAIEEQFYLAWPLLMLAVIWWCRRRGGQGLRPRLAIALGTLTAVSFGYAVALSTEQPGVAYFSTLTRGWELAVGGLLALVPATWWRLSERTCGVLAISGLATVAAGALRITDESAFPGPWALLPVLGTAAVIAAGCCSQANSAARLLSTPPMRHVGRISYSWYLWHWPAVVFAPLALGDLSTSQTVFVVAATWVPAALTHRFVEEPVRRAPTLVPTQRALTLGIACTTATVVVAGTSWATAPTVDLASAKEVEGAAALDDPDQPQDTAERLRPLPDRAKDDRGRAHDDDCLASQPKTDVTRCEYGATDSTDTIVLFGDSHAMHYAPALEIIAERRNMKLVTIAKAACSPADVTIFNSQLERQYSECNAWHERAMKQIENERPALIVTGNNEQQTVMEGGEKLNAAESAHAMEEGYTRTLRQLRDTGAKVVTMADNPHPPRDIPSCVSEAFENLDACMFSAAEGTPSPEPVNVNAAASVQGTKVIDPKPVLCKNGKCPAVVGDVIVYRSGAHITATYMETLTDWLDERLPRTNS